MASYNDLNFEWSLLCNECAAWSESGKHRFINKFYYNIILINSQTTFARAFLPFWFETK